MLKISKASLPPGFDIQGHRGCRGLLPENSLPAFKKALELKVTTLELDLVISKDLRVVVSHEPFFSHQTCLTPEEKPIPENQEIHYNIFKMDYNEIRRYDCGSKLHPGFPKQIKISVFKPLFNEVVDFAEIFTRQNNLQPVNYNIEIKSTPEGDNFFHPTPEVFSDLVYQSINEKGIISRTIVQSFDLRPLQYIRKKYPAVRLSLLIENPLEPEENLTQLGFTPDIYSPDYSFVNEKLISLAKKNKMKIIPWTVNTPEEIKKLVDLGVHGIITDYPDLFE